MPTKDERGSFAGACGGLRPASALNAPRPLVVEAAEGPDGLVPQWVVWRGKRRRVAAVEDVWQVDDEWWRDAVSRRYFSVTLASPQTDHEGAASRRVLPSARQAWDARERTRVASSSSAALAGERLTLFYDLSEGTWWAQRYALPHLRIPWEESEQR